MVRFLLCAQQDGSAPRVSVSQGLFLGEAATHSPNKAWAVSAQSYCFSKKENSVLCSFSDMGFSAQLHNVIVVKTGKILDLQVASWGKLFIYPVTAFFQVSRGTEHLNHNWISYFKVWLCDLKEFSWREEIFFCYLNSYPIT